MDYPSNSHTARDEKIADPEPKKIDPVVTGGVRRRKTPLGKRFAETFVGGDINNVVSYVVFEVLVPAAKDTISDAFSQGIDRMLFGESRGSRRSSGRTGTGTNGYVSYNRMATSATKTRSGLDEFARREPSRRARQTHDFDEIILDSRHEAEEVLTRLYDLLETYEAATVADLYELVGVTPNYTDAKWGWAVGGLQGARVERTRGGGFLLDLPKPEAIE